MSGGWNTIESDAGVFTYLLTSLGVSDVQFEELLTLEPSSLASLSPLGVIFLFKYPVGEKPTSTPHDGSFDYNAIASPGEANNIWFAAQTIQNACGTQALLGVLMNKQDSIELGPTLSEFRDFTSFFDADLKGEALSNSNQIRDAHNSFARSSPFVSDETKMATEDDDLYHFVAYSSINGTLYELDGLQPAPISHGACKEDEFAEKVVPVLQRRIERYPAHEIRFNLLAMCRDLRIKAREIGDQEWLYREEEKRRAWRWENALRRHNFVGFVGELLKGVVEEKVKKGEYEGWVEEAKGRTRKKVEEQRKRGKGGDEMDIS
ncbi:ubiquitin carboxyl-terminal hydrolase [Elsinoe ampelina]|uniref:Ubiquitin carboxyl-terminal hydrolase n=1 Tax=Elsinoe ampelina TaxID=302913 RepID=A0A6A6GB90_9PEZI|nr:ubiquitin carboxyl-terminal hydrolase [Elsinoe ampelina]